LLARRRIGTAILSGLVTEVVNKIVPFLVLHLAMSRVGVESFGYGQYILTLVDFANLAVILGYQNYAAVALARFSDNPAKMGAALTTFLLIKISHALVVSLCLFSPLVALPEHSAWILVIGAISSSLDLSPLLMVEKRLVLLNHAAIVGKLLNLCGMWWFVHTPDDGSLVPLFAVMANSVVSLFSLVAGLRSCPPRRTNFTQMRQFATQSWPFIGPIVLFLLLDRMDILILERLFGMAEMGRYASSCRLVQSAMPFVIMISNVFYSETLGQSSVEANRKHFSLAVEAVVLLTVCLAAAIFLFADVIYALIYGTADVEAISVLRTLSTLVIAHGIYLVCVQQVLYVNGLTRYVSAALFVGIAIIAALFSTGLVQNIVSMAMVTVGARFFCAAVVFVIAMRQLQSFPRTELKRALIFTLCLGALVQWASPLDWHWRVVSLLAFVGPWGLFRLKHLLPDKRRVSG